MSLHYNRGRPLAAQKKLRKIGQAWSPWRSGGDVVSVAQAGSDPDRV